MTSARAEQGGCRKQRGQRVGRGELRAVEQRQPLLGAERQRSEAGRGQGLGGGLAAMRRVDLADADHGRRHVRQRRQIARGADRALAGHHWHQAIGQHRLQHGDGGGAHARGTLGEARELEGQHQPNDGHGRRLANTCRVRQHDVGLQPRQVGRRDAHAGELAEARIDSVDRLALGHDGLDRMGARLDRRQAGWIELGTGAAVDGAPALQAHRARLQGDVAGSKAHRPLHTRACSGLKPMR